MEKPLIYLDNNATTRVAPEVLEDMLPYLGEKYGNPSSMHTFGGSLRRDIEAARGQVADLLGAEPGEIVFTSSGTESDNTALAAALSARPDRRHIITSRVEHPAVLNYCRHLEQKGYRITRLPVDDRGRLDMEAFRECLDDDTAVVSIMYANNETGTLLQVEEIGRILSERGILFHTDAVQAAGKVPIDVKDLPVHMLSISGHKLHAPKGVGALYIRSGTPFSPYLIGGHQEGGRRAGTENLASIIGLGRACSLARENLADEAAYVGRLRDRLEAGLLAACPESLINGDRENRLPNTTNIGFEYVEGEAILLKLDAERICASSGSACSSGSPEPSPVLSAMNVPASHIHGSIRLSLSRYNTAEEIDRALEILPPVINELRELSPFGKK